MKNLLLILILLTSVSAHGQALDDFLRNMPDSILPYFKKESMQLLLGFTGEDGDTLSSQSDDLGGKVWLSHKSERLVTIHTSSTSEIQVAMIPNANDTLFCFIKTQYAPEAESRVIIYNKVWEPQRTIELEKYANIQFPDTMPSVERNELLKMVEMKMYSAKILPEEPDMLVIIQNLPVLSAEEKSRFKACKMQTKLNIMQFL